VNICLMSGGHVPEAEKFVKIALLQDLWQIHCNTMMGTRKIFVFFYCATRNAYALRAMCYGPVYTCARHEPCSIKNG